MSWKLVDNKEKLRNYRSLLDVATINRTRPIQSRSMISESGEFIIIIIIIFDFLLFNFFLQKILNPGDLTLRL